MLAEFSGYTAADELYDGPFCVLSIVDNRTFRRITGGRPELRTLRDIMNQVYRLFDRRCRTKPHISSRVALDMQREERTQQRERTTQTLHAARTRKAA